MNYKGKEIEITQTKRQRKKVYEGNRTEHPGAVRQYQIIKHVCN